MPRKRNISTELSVLLREQKIAVSSIEEIETQLQQRMAGQMHAYLQIALTRMQKHYLPRNQTEQQDIQIAELMQLLHRES